MTIGFVLLRCLDAKPLFVSRWLSAMSRLAGFKRLVTENLASPASSVSAASWLHAYTVNQFLTSRKAIGDIS